MKYTLTFLVALLTLTLPAQLRINELMTNNVSAVWDDAYNFSMWVELYNPTSSSISQSYYYLTDNPEEPRKWQLPSKVIASNGYSILWMENPDRTNHAPFKLDPDGGVLYLLTSTGAVADYVLYPAQHRNVSYGRLTDGSETFVFFEDCSPEASNNGRATGSEKCAMPVLSTPGGLYTGSVVVRFEPPVAGDTIYYNLNSNEPTRNSLRYSPGSSITISSNSVVRAKTFRKGKLSSDVTTATYLIGQRNFNLPVVSIVTPPAYLTDNTVGIYVAGTNGIPGNGESAPRNWNQDWDRPANFELFDMQKVNRLNQELDIQIGGGWSRMNAQKSLHIKPKKKFGNNKLSYPLFGSRNIQEYRDISMRNSGNDFKYSMMRDGMMQSLIIGRMDLDYLAYEPAVIYINGVYYGIQNIRERSNADLIYTSHGLDEEEILHLDGMSPGHPQFQEMLNYILNNDIRQPAVYEQLKTMMDVDNYMEYMMTQIFVGNYDWPHNNVKIWKKIDGGKWRWILYDTDFGFNLYDGSLHSFNSLAYALGENSGKTTEAWATRLFSRLVLNETFKNDFIDRFSIHLSSTFTTQRINHTIDSLASRIRTEITYHKNRWGSDRAFESDINTMKTFSSARATNMLGFLRSRFLNGAALQSIDLSSNITAATYTFNNQLISDHAISLNSFNGRSFTLKANDSKGYTFKHWELTGTTQNQTVIPWDSQWKYWDGSSIPAANWQALTYSDASWKTGVAQLGYGGKGEKTTVGYGSDANNKYPTAYFRKSFALQDVTSINSATIRIFVDDGAAVYVNGTEIGRYNLPAGTLAFNTYSTTYNNGEYADFTIPSSLLRNGTNVIAVEVHQTNATSSDLIFNLELNTQTVLAGSAVNTSQVLTGVLASNLRYRAIYEEDTTPDPVVTASLFINELVASNSTIADENGDKDDYFELYNAGDQPVDVSGWFVSDKPTLPRLWQLPVDAQVVVPAKGFLVLWADGQPDQGPLHVDFKLSASGEFVSLYAENKFGELLLMDSVTLPALPANQSYSRVPDGSQHWIIQSPTPLGTNISSSTDATPFTVRVYPTQFSDYLTVENTGGHPIGLYDLTGKQLYHSISNDQSVTLELSHLQSGIYLIKVGDQVFRVSKR
jgi:hypothetical protein